MMTFPTVHLNGTSKKELLDQWRIAYLALHDARNALQLASPHGRDYYPQGPEVICAAQAEHRDRLAKIEAVMEELDELSLRIAFPS
jgi:hypothetical protein